MGSEQRNWMDEVWIFLGQHPFGVTMETNFSKWKEYFLKNKLNLKFIDWDDNYKLTTSEREIIIKSIQQFQLGENSEGKYLINRARKYVLKTQDQYYYDALVLETTQISIKSWRLSFS